MRLHHLEMRAFGPFAGTERVDLDAASDAGLFLLSGPTGAGKTSILDAVCFALYGHVPGERDRAKRLRSDHAPPERGPRVVLDVTLRGRRLRITRSPEWLRPKKRGSGRTKEPAKVLLEEHVDGSWQQRSGRIDEAADLLGDLLGVTVGQFCQVALLPQGRFESFLQAGAAERHALLERLFDTRRFRAIEDWLAEHRTTLARRSAEHESRVSTVVARAAEVSRRPAPADDTGGPRLDHRVVEWSADTRDAVVEALSTARVRRTEIDLEVKRLRSELDDARVRADLQQRHADALVRRERLHALADDTEHQRRRVADARSAEAVAPVAALHEESAGRCDDARSAAHHCWPAAEPLLPVRVRAHMTELFEQTTSSALHGEAPADSDPETLVESLWEPLSRSLSTEVDAARGEHARLTALLPAQEELDEVIRRTGVTVEEATRQIQQRDHTAARGDDLRQRRGELVAELSRLNPLTKQRSALEHAVADAEQRVRAAERAERARTRRHELGATVSRATERAQSAREAWLDIRERRLDGMAAELAGQLSPGEACPVCGAAEHPAPAVSGPGSVSAEDEQRAQDGFHELDAERARCDHLLRACESELAAAAAEAHGGTVDEARAAHAEAVGHLETAAAGQQREHEIREELATLEQAESATLADLRRLDAELAAVQERRVQLERRRDELERTITSAISSSAIDPSATMSGSGDAAPRDRATTPGNKADLPTRLDRAAESEQVLSELHDAVARWRAAAAEHESRARHLDDALQSAGFADVAQARAVRLSSSEISDLESLLQARSAEQHRVDGVLSDPAVSAAAESAPVDIDALEHRLAAAEQARDTVVADQTELARQADRLEQLHSELDAALAAWQPVRAAHDTAGGLAALCGGTSPDNPDRVRLSSYVLAARLTQVVDAANERLTLMSAGRYVLERTDARGVGDRRGGLGLRVCDGWTGESRDPATLSGGESFVASLALALGLADVVAFEAGGVELGTLFVDEGFGSLDADTLDEVLDVLDDLRSGGRVVGLVSHVPELRARVGAQVRVTKAHGGSTLVQV